MEVLIDGHCHSVLAADLEPSTFELAITEASVPSPTGLSYLDSPIGLAIRRWCAPVLGLPPHAPVDDYLRQRSSMGWQQATSALLRSASLGALLVDTGLGGLLDLPALADAAGASVHEVVRLEHVAEQIADSVDAHTFASVFAETLNQRVRAAVAVKSIVAYRSGLAVSATRPAPAEVRQAAGGWLRAGGRLTDPVLLSHILWSGVDTGLPVQLHTGFGDRDVRLPSADPSLLQAFLAAAEPSGVPIVLLHCYPYHRQAGWLAQVYPHVYVDVGLTITQLGVRAESVIGEFFELAPFGKLLFSTDAYLLPELYAVGAAQFRRGLRRLLDEWRSDDAVSAADAERIASQVSAGNAQRIYRL
jgi:predicted TIM-barrel fold metal-dependent hydrolase